MTDEQMSVAWPHIEKLLANQPGLLRQMMPPIPVTRCYELGNPAVFLKRYRDFDKTLPYSWATALWAERQKHKTEARAKTLATIEAVAVESATIPITAGVKPPG